MRFAEASKYVGKPASSNYHNIIREVEDFLSYQMYLAVTTLVNSSHSLYLSPFT